MESTSIYKHVQSLEIERKSFHGKILENLIVGLMLEFTYGI